MPALYTVAFFDLRSFSGGGSEGVEFGVLRVEEILTKNN
jgi:hypothetical protein